MVDKFEAKKYIAGIIGDKFIVPNLGCWDDVNQIDIQSLPNQFVLKWNHDSGSVVVCKDKSTFNFEHAKELLARGKDTNGFWYGREWPYKNVPHHIIAEEYLGSDLQDYRIYCYNGEPKYIYTYSNVSPEDGSKPEPEYCDVYDCDWNPMSFRQKCPPKGNIPRPIGLDDMLECSRKISQVCPFLRVDFYQIGERVFIGELTFFPGSGLTRFVPEKWNEILGSWLKLPEKINKTINK